MCYSGIKTANPFLLIRNYIIILFYIIPPQDCRNTFRRITKMAGLLQTGHLKTHWKYGLAQYQFLCIIHTFAIVIVKVDQVSTCGKTGEREALACRH
jgi:hypothetical protein